MANDNQIDFKVRLQREGVSELAGDLKNIDESAKDLAQAATAAGAGVDRLESSSKDAGDAVSALGADAKQAQDAVTQLAAAEDAADDQARGLGTGSKAAADGVKGVAQAATVAAVDLGELAQAVDAKTKAIKAGLQVEQSEIELQRQHLVATQAEQQARLKAAQAQGDEAAATRALTALRQAEADQMGLVARAKRAEATAVDMATAARREELSAIGPLNAAQAKELQAAENYAKALRVEAAAADQAAQRTRDMGTAQRSAAGTTDQLSGRIGNLTQLLGQMAGALGAAFTFREMVTAAAQMESMSEGLRAVSGSAEQAGKDMDFVRTVANRVGADVTQVGQAFLGLQAATKGTAVEGEPTRQVFEAVATAMGKAGKSASETQNALVALAQMASKGTVSMEELRGQLGEALPGALQAAANGLGITTQDLIKLVEEGQIAASDLFPALSKGLNDLYGGAPAAQTLSQEITNIKNAFTEMAANIGEAGGFDALKVGAEVAQTAIVLLDDTLITVGKTLGVLAGAVATLDFSGVEEAFADIEKESRDKLLKAAQHNDTLRGYIKSMGNEALSAAVAQQELAKSTQQAGQAAAAQGLIWVNLASDYGKVLEAVREQIAQAEKSVIARDAEGKAAVALAAAFGTEAEQRQAQAKAAQANAQELEKLAQLKTTELNVMQAELAALKALATEHGKLDNAKTKQLQELEKQIALRQQDADKAVAQAQAGRLAAESAKLEAEAYKDNSGRVKELGEAYEQARLKLEQVRAAKAAGKATTEEVTAAETEAGKAARLYRDALSDLVKALEAKNNAQQADAALATSALQLQLAQEKSYEASAKAMGNEVAVIASKIRQKEIEIKIIEATVQAQIAEAEGSIAVARAKMTEMEATGKLDAVKKAELESTIKIAQARINQAKATGESTKVMEAEITALRLGTDARNKSTASIDANRTALERLNAEKEREIAAMEKANDLATRELQLQEAKRNAGTINNVDAVPAFESEEQAEAWLKAWKAQYQRDNPFSTKRGGQLGNFMHDMTMFEYNKELDAMALRNAMKGNGNATTSNQTPLESMRSGATYVSNVTIPGVAGTTTVRYADADSQRNGEDLLRKLAQAKGASI